MSDNSLVHLVINPVAGDRTAQEFVKTIVKPLLRAAGYEMKTYETQREGDAARIAREIGDVSAGKGSDSVLTVLLAGGDGTAHEFIEGIYGLKGKGKGGVKWNLVILPLGTANALYASTYPPGTPPPTFSETLQPHLSSYNETSLSSLCSLAAFLGAKANPTRLPISALQLLGPEISSPPTIVTSHVVISTCLHANLLATAESLRTDYPGVERFKVAARENAGKFFSAEVKLQPTLEGAVQVYDPKTTSFTDLPENMAGKESDGSAILEDDFAYFLSSATCPRLEPTFVISPLISRLPFESSIDIVILRPDRDPRVKAVLSKAGYKSIAEARKADDEAALKAASEAWVPRAWEVLGKAYEDGAHVDLTYTEEGDVESKGDRAKVVEVYRCGGFEWTPLDKDDRDSHLFCADGSLIHLSPGGTGRVQLEEVEKADDGGEIYLWA